MSDLTEKTKKLVEKYRHEELAKLESKKVFELDDFLFSKLDKEEVLQKNADFDDNFFALESEMREVVGESARSFANPDLISDDELLLLMKNLARNIRNLKVLVRNY